MLVNNILQSRLAHENHPQWMQRSFGHSPMVGWDALPVAAWTNLESVRFREVRTDVLTTCTTDTQSLTFNCQRVRGSHASEFAAVCTVLRLTKLWSGLRRLAHMSTMGNIGRICGQVTPVPFPGQRGFAGFFHYRYTSYGVASEHLQHCVAERATGFPHDQDRAALPRRFT